MVVRDSGPYSRKTPYIGVDEVGSVEYLWDRHKVGYALPKIRIPHACALHFLTWLSEFVSWVGYSKFT